MRILDTEGNTLVEYSYDPWGVPTVTGNTELADINPCSYRCYDYDEESGLYYLQSRYYNPESGRFMSADAHFDEKADIQAYNLFSYCTNNPIVYADGDGYALDVVFDSVSIVWSLIDLVKSPSIKNAIFLAWDIVATLTPLLPGSWTVKGGKLCYKVADSISDLKYADDLMTGSYKQLKKVFKGKKNVQIHHLVEQRFRILFKNTKTDDYLSIPLSIKFHNVITQRWRSYFPYGMNYKNISKSEMRKAIKWVYRDMPKVRDETLRWFEKNWRNK